MFGIPGKAAVKLTPMAARQIAGLMAEKGSEGLRIGVKKGGCAGNAEHGGSPSEDNLRQKVGNSKGGQKS